MLPDRKTALLVLLARQLFDASHGILFRKHGDRITGHFNTSRENDEIIAPPDDHKAGILGPVLHRVQLID